ncbi:hypothetical protein LX87_00786 [Larkinella arboricola]|uniref:Sortilin (Neurotensin receptor 3) n=1 Tax=Larkinella arboricola TaxID=643671 RepID=A0A327XEK5_LARAB|nr:hypothetical protein [Larkinella arboricola]RAK02666.1 hypothetical protein LX87_00786 [Larkinella arboricola]
MKKLIYLCLAVLAFSCKKNEPEFVLPTYNDWYVFQSPTDRPIEGVWGDIDKTLLISTGIAVYRSVDRGKTWQEVVGNSRIGIFGIIKHQDTLFTMTGLSSVQKNAVVQHQALVNPDSYSLDDGRTWQPYKGYNAALDYHRLPEESRRRLFINPVSTSTRESYTINMVYLDDSTKALRRFETPGVMTATGRRIDLPQLHQLKSLYLDASERLYLAGTDAVCSNGQRFAFCNSQAGRGMVYVSKRPRP